MSPSSPAPPAAPDASPPSHPAESLPASSVPILRHPRGRLAPPLPSDAPRWRRFVRTANRLGRGLVLHDALQAAPAMAFHFFLSLLPLLVFVGYVVGLVARRRGVNTVLAPLLDSLPEAAEPMVKDQVGRLAGAGSGALGPLAAIGFLWIASGGTQGLMHALETLVGAPRRPWLKKRAIALGWVIATLGAFALAGLAILQWDSTVHPSGPPAATHANLSNALSATAGSSASPDTTAGPNVMPARGAERRMRRRIERGGGERTLGLAVSFVFATAMLAAFYLLSVSHSKRVARRVAPGAALAIVLWFAISWLFGRYVASLAEYSVYYGSLTAVAVLLIWLWLTSLTILVGAEYNAQLEGLRDLQHPLTPLSPGESSTEARRTALDACQSADEACSPAIEAHLVGWRSLSGRLQRLVSGP